VVSSFLISLILHMHWDASVVGWFQNLSLLKFNPMKKNLSVILFMLATFAGNSQNLIYNGDFEVTTGCPVIAPFNLIAGWTCPNAGSPDYFKQCATGLPIFGVPVNFPGVQAPHSGDVYCGIITRNSGNPPIDEWREYIQSQLINPLQPGAQYDLTMYVSLADSVHYGSDAIGALFSTTAISRSDNFTFTQTPQVLNTSGNFIVDKSNWTRISLSFTADSAYNYITIGNFFDNAHTPVVTVSGGALPRTYFYLDDICLIPKGGQCSVLAGISAGDNDALAIYPNPFFESLQMDVANKAPVEIILYDLFSRKRIHLKEYSSGSIATGDLAAGIYFYEVRDRNGLLRKGKLVKE